MTRLKLLGTVAAATFALPAQAEVPRVIADIAPVHSLVAQVMDGLGTPDLLIEPGTDAHNLTLRPTVARQLDAANLVVRVGPELTPWLEDPLSSLASDAEILTLLDTDGWTPRMYAEADAAHDHAEGEDDHDHDHDEKHDHDHADADHDHEEHDHADHDHGDHDDDHDHDHAAEGGEDHAVEEAHNHDHDHDHTGLDPHAWLDPQIAVVWVGAIRDALIEADPENAGIYTQNADDATTRLATLEEDVAEALPGSARGTWLAPHDFMGYFGARFDTPSAAAVAEGDAAAPGPGRVGDLREMVEDGTVTCVLTESNTNENRAATLTEGTSARTGFVNATGAGLTPGPDLYSDLLQQIAATLAECTAS
ncbi:hypothetical protein EU805_09985 [Salipiger sp. IMCC34102]|uniref:zinc ABC transporter substrate-binding protein n=1 Tax=Salipiger sp. IMCC34102 TaxID=2510647 RepID=UPI00101D684D|nr:zinc ABC transporter substrate-binding protein [Salipiger sp. IMCC34102]RYH02181.1 hypothetical protein EU805_09985 [Salipiger sp. IMCC34102]